MKNGYERLVDMYSSWPEQFIRGYRAGSHVRLEWEGYVVFCGMGGSGSAGDFASIILEDLGFGKVVGVVKGFKLPPWIGGETLVVAVSYSGNTYETLRCIKEAEVRKAPILAVTSGGTLWDYSSKKGLAVARVSEGLVPRAALAEMVGAIVGALDPSKEDGGGSSLVSKVSEALSRVSFAEFRRMARGFYRGGPVVVSSCGRFGLVAERWRTELGENSKVIAKSEVYPESGHNDIVAWQSSDQKASFVIVEGPWEPECNRVMDRVARVYSEHGPLLTYRVRAGHLPGALLEAALAGGFFSVALALERGLDPIDTSIISEFKDSFRGLDPLR